MGSDPLFTDGVIVIDKPAGPTSHDVVAVMRRAARGKKVGHTGTLDPLASGVLPLVLGKATRLAQFLSSADKEYEADIELGVSTTTLDRGGEVVERIGTREVATVTRAMIDEAVAAFRGTYLQQPPDYSAKKIDGDRAYDLARRNLAVQLQPVQVTAVSLDVIEWSGSRLRLRLACTAGYYVRSLAEAIGERLGTGAHLAGLVRIRSGEFTLGDAVSLDILDRSPGEAAARVVPLSALLTALPAVVLTADGASLAARGGYIGEAHVTGGQSWPQSGRVRLLHPDGRLVAIAEPRAGGVSGLLHPGGVLE
jgi:tRNA pseudouridine55 synthase